MFLSEKNHALSKMVSVLFFTYSPYLAKILGGHLEVENNFRAVFPIFFFISYNLIIWLPT